MSRLFATPLGRFFAPVRYLPHRVNVQRTVDLLDDAGGRIPTPVTIATAVPCWVQPLSGNEQLQYLRQDLVLTDKVIFLQNPGVQNEDVLLFGSRSLVVQGVSNELEMNMLWTVTTRDISHS